MQFNHSYLQKYHYVFWRRESNVIFLTQKEFVKKFNELKETRKLVKYSTRRQDYTDKTFSFSKKGDYFRMFCYEDEKYITYSTNSTQDSKNGQEYEGSRAISLFNSAFKARKGISLYKCYGTVNESFKAYIPKQFSYVNENYLNKEIKASGVDFSSSYPSCMCGPLPDSHTAIEVEGYVDPTKEYPFAFYTNGYCAEYEVFDTREWKGNYYFKYLFNYFNIKKLRNVEVKTILMKASPIRMDDIWEDFYNNRKISDEAKLVMNRAIGMMHTKKYTSHKYAHLVAIAIGRNNQRILNLAKKISYDKVVHICVDGIIYNTYQVFGNDEKKLGNLYQEFVGCDFKMTGPNKYIVLCDGECVKAKHGNCNTDIKEDKDIKSLDEQNNWKLVQPLKEIEEYAKTLQEEQSKEKNTL